MHEISEAKWYRLSPGILDILLLDAAQKEKAIHNLNYYFKVKEVDMGIHAFGDSGPRVWWMPFCVWRSDFRKTSIAPVWLIEIDWLDEFPTERQLEICQMLGMQVAQWTDDQK